MAYLGLLILAVPIVVLGIVLYLHHKEGKLSKILFCRLFRLRHIQVHMLHNIIQAGNMDFFLYKLCLNGTFFLDEYKYGLIFLLIQQIKSFRNTTS